MHRHARISPRKARLVIGLIRGQRVSTAQGVLRFTPQRGSALVAKVLAAAIANANEKEADAILDGALGKHISDKMPQYGLVNLAYWENGFRNLTNSKKPVTKWEDIGGLKVRVMQNNIFLDTFKTMGANAVPMAFGERLRNDRRRG